MTDSYSSAAHKEGETLKVDLNQLSLSPGCSRFVKLWSGLELPDWLRLCRLPTWTSITFTASNSVCCEAQKTLTFNSANDVQALLETATEGGLYMREDSAAVQASRFLQRRAQSCSQTAHHAAWYRCRFHVLPQLRGGTIDPAAKHTQSRAYCSNLLRWLGEESVLCKHTSVSTSLSHENRRTAIRSLF